MLSRSVLLFLALSLCQPAAASAAANFHDVPAARLAARIAAGKPVAHYRADIKGPLVLPFVVRAPIELTNCIFRGRIYARHTRFESLVDLTSSVLQEGIDARNARFMDDFLFQSARSTGPVRLSLAAFDRAANFSQASFEARVTFDRAAFQRDARFAGASFTKPASFLLASFDGTADFQVATFDRRAGFGQAQFGDEADFSYATFNGNVDFKGARFAQEAEFIASEISTEPEVWATFEDVRFAAGGNFSGVPFPPVTTFHRSRAGGDMDFEQGSFSGDADFGEVRYRGRLNFRRAKFASELLLEEAFVQTLDLTGSAPKQLWLPERAGIGSVGGLLMDVEDVVSSAPGQDEAQRRVSRVRMLRLVEDTARAADDLGTANAALIRWRELKRDARPFLEMTGDWVFWWGLMGYLVQPSHQLVLILVLLVLGSAVRIHHRKPNERKANADTDVEETFRALFRLAPPSDWPRLIEYVAFKFALIALFVNIGNVWPPFRELVEGVL